MISSSRIEVDGRVVYAEHTGGGRAGRAGPPVVLVHGLGLSSRSMRPLLRALDEGAGTDSTIDGYAIDLPGYGRSADPDRPLRLDGLVAALVGWLDATGLDRVALVGNSLGAQLVIMTAAAHPERVSHAVLVGTTRDPRSGGRLGHAARLLVDGCRERPSLLPVAIRDYLRAGPRQMAALFRQALGQPEEHQLRRVAAPTLIVRGTRDPISGSEWNRRIAGLIPNAELVEIAGAPHAVNYSASVPLAAVIRSFLDRAG
jgi:pimeloyl-ACP methyl ester carboxylesterase